MINRDDIIKLAREAGFDELDMWGTFDAIERFAALVAAAAKAEEREACAKVCEDTEFDSDADFYRPDFAAVIRARGQA